MRRKYARKKAATVEAFRVEEIVVRDAGRCGICGEPISRANYPDPLSLSIDHIVPLSRGGAHSPWNVQVAHLACNVAKGTAVFGGGS